MASHHALFPGSFDPFTLGHLDLVRRAQALFGRVTVGVAQSREKKTLFDTRQRVELVREATRGVPGVEVMLIEGLVIHAAEKIGADVIVRGVRTGTDFDFETQMSHTNRAMLPRVDTVFFVPAPELSHISSTLVREIAQLGGDATRFVPPNVAVALAQRPAR